MPRPNPQPLTPDFLRQRITKSIGNWKSTLSDYDLKDLNKPDPEGGWTLGQVFTHCYLAASRLFITMAEACVEEGQVDGIAKKNEVGQKLFAYQSFPPIQIDMPEGLAFTPPEPDSIDRLQEQLDKIERRCNEAIAALERNPQINASRPHPAFGDLTTQEWLLMISMHYDHHLRQRDRLTAGL